MEHFLDIPAEKILFKNDYFFIIRDGFPVSPGHLLIISNELRIDYFELSAEEKSALPIIIEVAKNLIRKNTNPMDSTSE